MNTRLKLVSQRQLPYLYKSITIAFVSITIELIIIITKSSFFTSLPFIIFYSVMSYKEHENKCEIRSAKDDFNTLICHVINVCIQFVFYYRLYSQATFI